MNERGFSITSVVFYLQKYKINQELDYFASLFPIRLYQTDPRELFHRELNTKLVFVLKDSQSWKCVRGSRITFKSICIETVINVAALTADGIAPKFFIWKLALNKNFNSMSHIFDSPVVAKDSDLENSFHDLSHRLWPVCIPYSHW